ncbi:MAG TPA: SRPBCC family protein [Thermoleophilaceae bacterium]|nr:SRPBCC family protein [Thermoleophilaceae bacterium]
MNVQAATTSTAVHKSIVVDAPIERAFHVYTQEMTSWWPPDHHILDAPLSEMTVEPREGGRIYDVGTDGSECQWARVLAYEPPTLFVFSWDINLQWEIETDHERTSEVEVRFTAEGDGRTRVDLEHRNLDRHGGGWEKMREAVGSHGGWGVGLDRFAQAAAA